MFSKENRSNYLFNSKIEGLDKCDYLLLIGANLRVDSAILNARIRKNYIHRDLKISSISSQKFDLKMSALIKVEVSLFGDLKDPSWINLVCMLKFLSFNFLSIFMHS